jgi:iron complex outermembrane receptor protein
MSAAMNKTILRILAANASPLVLIAAGMAHAATDTGTTTAVAAAEAPAIQEVLVTARKRDETLISTPVVENAVGGKALSRLGINDLDGLSRIVPQVIIAPEGSSVQGGIVTIRGISGQDSNPFADQAVAFNIDGEQVAKASVRRMSDFDVSQVEVLKGPQALFFGKNSPAGVISIKTNDPTDRFEAGISTGYEFYADETRTEAYVSGPLAKNLSGRLAGYYSHMEGWLKDQTPPSSPYYDTGRDPLSSDFGLRGTLKWTPTDRLEIKLKLNYAETDNNGRVSTIEYIHCPTGHRQTGSPAECTAGDYTVNASSGPIIGAFPGTLNTFGDGKSFVHQKQTLDSLEINYHVSPALLLTAVTGYYYADLTDTQNFQNDYAIIVPSDDPYSDSEFSQEIRVVSDFHGPFNFAAGAYFSDTHASTGALSYLFGSNFDLLGPGFGGPTTPFQINDYFLKQDGQAYSAYLQLIFKPVSVLEIDLGGRYSYEKKSLPLVESSPTAILDASSVLNTPVRNDSWDDFSPEATVAYRPTPDLTIFGSYKHGFLSGGFNSGSPNFASNPDLSYLPETIEGGEIGVKAALFDRTLRVNLAGYIYDVSDLQIASYTNAQSSITNAGAVDVKGVEADFTYQTPVRGLSIHGAAAYNRGKYTKYVGAPCYNGQTIAQGCTIVNGNPEQNLSGTELIRAPELNLSGGYDYERAIGHGLNLGLSTDVSYSSSFLTDATSDPGGREPAYTLVDSTLRLSTEDGRWEWALIGRNLTDRHYWVGSINAPFTGSGTATAEGVPGDRAASVSRGREIMLRVSFKY